MVSFAHYELGTITEAFPPMTREHIKLLQDQIPEGDSDLVIAIGEYGTFVKAIAKYPKHEILCISDNDVLGYLSAIKLENVGHIAIENIQWGDYSITKLPLLSCYIGEKEHTVFDHVKVLHKKSLQEYGLQNSSDLGGKYTVTIGKDCFEGSEDGIFLCTPQGSNSPSWKGKIIDWGTRAYGVQLPLIWDNYSPSIIVPENTETKVKITYPAIVEMDGTERDLEKGVIMTVCFSKECAQLVSFR